MNETYLDYHSMIIGPNAEPKSCLTLPTLPEFCEMLPYTRDWRLSNPHKPIGDVEVCVAGGKSLALEEDGSAEAPSAPPFRVLAL